MRTPPLITKHGAAKALAAVILLCGAAGAGSGQTKESPGPPAGLAVTLTDEQGKDLQTVLLPAVEPADRDTVLSKTFGRSFKPGERFRVKVENRTTLNWEVVIFKAGPDGGCVSTLPFRRLQWRGGIVTEEVTPGQHKLSSTLGVTGRGGEERFAVLASPSSWRLAVADLFTSVEYLAGEVGGRVLIPNLSAVDAETRTGEPKGKGEADKFSVGQSGWLTITLGNVYSQSGQALKSADFYDALLLVAGCYYRLSPARVQHRVSFDELAVAWLNNQGLANYQTGDLGAARANYTESLRRLGRLRRADRRHHRGEEVVIRTNLGLVYATLGDQTRALEAYGQALNTLYEGTEGPREVEQNRYAAIYNGLGASREAMGEYAAARKHYEDALAIQERASGKAAQGLTLNSLGRLAAGEKNYRRAEELFLRARELSLEAGNPAGVGSANNNLGALYVRLKKYGEAAEAFHDSALTFRALGNRTALATALANLMYVESLRGRPRLAVLYGKEAVNLLQSVRGGLADVEKHLQKSFLLTREGTYRLLSDILIAEGRIVEAEQVLQMLKQDEVSEFLRRDASELDDLGRRADATPEERAALGRYKAHAETIAALGAELGRLRALRRQGVALGEAGERRLAELAGLIADANRSFQVLVRQLGEEFAARPDVRKELQEDLGLKSDLKAWGGDVAFLYTLVGEDRYRVVLFTPDSQADGKFDIKASVLEEKIARFRAAVRDQTADPRGPGRELYDILVKPVEKQLEGAGVKTLLWSLDGNLRLLPLAALWDGHGYFGEKYRNVVVTLGSRTRLGAAPAPGGGDWRVLGLGVTRDKTVASPVGDRPETFRALPGVETELRSIVRKTDAERGVLPGQRLLDAAFSREELLRELGLGYKVVHIASHFKLDAGGDATRSFLLLGDGQALTVEQIQNDPLVSFDGVELLTLSACQTAVVGRNDKGREVEGFGYVAQRKGARAILASLWSVEDESTSLLMSEFYRLRKEQPGLTKAEALRQAQLSLRRGAGAGGRARSRVRRDAGGRSGARADGLPEFPFDPDAPFAHPFFWSPFILIGDWR